jgi:hypothetical protein
MAIIDEHGIINCGDDVESDPESDDGRCPKCGGELFQGYGLMGGGVGTYEGCEEDDCDYFRKEQDQDDGKLASIPTAMTKVEP